MEKINGVKAVFFDAGNTLIFPNYRLIQEALSARGIGVTADQLFRMDCELRDQYNRLAVAGEDTKERWDNYWVTWLQRAGMTQDIRAAVIKELTMRNEQGHLWLQVLEGTPEVLARLKESGRILGVVSNSEGRLEAFLEQVGLRQYFEFVLDSAIVGVEKPDAAIFQMALERAHVRPGEALMVGDNYALDIISAR